MIVVDASALTVALGDDGADGRTARARLQGESLAAPELVDLEVASALRRLVAAGSMSAGRAGMALTDLTELPMQRASHRPLLSRCWELRQTITVYDAAYVALAEVLQVVLVTADGRLSRAPGVGCAVELVR